jgi:hypothetical protein
VVLEALVVVQLALKVIQVPRVQLVFKGLLVQLDLRVLLAL